MASQEDALAIAQNGGISSSDEGDLDGDDDLDDDLMDKISSSPSIEDGGFRPIVPPTAWPRRVSSLPVSLRDYAGGCSAVAGGVSTARPPSPFIDSTVCPINHDNEPLPLNTQVLNEQENHHLRWNEYEYDSHETDDDDDYEVEPEGTNSKRICSIGVEEEAGGKQKVSDQHNQG